MSDAARHVGTKHGPACGCGALRAEAARFGLTVPGLRRLVAIHEAGHAVAALARGIPVKRVALVCGNDEELGGFDCTYTPSSVPAVAVAYAAGERAQDRWLRESGLWTKRRARLGKKNASYDRAMIASLRWPGLVTHHAALAYLADVLLDANWDRVEAVAGALEERGCLEGREVSRLAEPRTTWTRDGGWSPSPRQPAG